METAAEPPNLKRTETSEAWTLKPCKPPAKPKTNLQLQGASDIPYPKPKLIRGKGLSFTVRSEIKKDIYSGFLGTRERTMVVKLYRPKDCLEDFDKVAIAIRALCAEHEAYEKMRHVAYVPKLYGLFWAVELSLYAICLEHILGQPFSEIPPPTRQQLRVTRQPR
jgi:hypothetical protein